MAIKPITPKQARGSKTFPDNVIDCWNAVITEKMNGPSARIQQEYIVQRLVASTGKTRQEIYDNGWLDVEDFYHKAGWDVSYDKPGYNESYEPYFIFQEQ